MESDIQAKILRYLEDEGIYAIKVQSANRRGAPDIILCLNGNYIGVEVKQPGKSGTPLQKYQHDKIRASGGEAWTVTSLAEFAGLLTRHPSYGGVYATR